METPAPKNETSTHTESRRRRLTPESAPGPDLCGRGAKFVYKQRQFQGSAGLAHLTPNPGEGGEPKKLHVKTLYASGSAMFEPFTRLDVKSGGRAWARPR